MLELLTAAEMSQADRLAVRAGVASLDLMESAGRAVADAAAGMVPARARVAVLCGPGNNGGDGFVAARHLASRGFDVSVFAMCLPEALQGDAQVMAKRWAGSTFPLDEFAADRVELVIDALFGTGLSRSMVEGNDTPLERVLRALAGRRVLAVDLPSGVDATTGAAQPLTPQAAVTITFFRRKTGHVLYPGRALCGEVRVCDIGIPAHVLKEIVPSVRLNAAPSRSEVVPRQTGLPFHKYSRGHTLVVSGPASATGASRLAARGALRAGSGLVSVASPPDALMINACHLTAIMVQAFKGPEGLAGILKDQRKSSIVIGPGCGVNAATRALVAVVLEANRAVVLDADALSAFAECPADLFGRIAKCSGTVVLTPHDGEFGRLFPGVAGSRLERAREAAGLSGAIIVLKGPDTVIAMPDGRAAINANAPAWLATAGSGDVLAGFVAARLACAAAAGVSDALAAVCHAVWLHGACAEEFGPGLIAEDIPEMVPKVLRGL